MNIGIVTTWFERGAAYVSKQFSNILKNENKLYIYARAGEIFGKNDDNWKQDNVTWDRKWLIPIETFISKRRFINWLKENNIEIVLFNEQRWFLPVIWCNEIGVKTGAYIDYYTESTIKLYNIFDFLICNTMRHYEVFNWHPQCYFIPWGTDINLFKPSNKKTASEKDLVFFHSAGMDAERKGTDILIRAFFKLKSDSLLIIHTQIDLKFSDKLTNENMKELITKNKLKIIQKDVHAPGLYFMGDIYVYPTRLEGIGLTIAEAMSCGLPTIVPDYPPMNEFVDEKSGKLVKIERLYSRYDGYYWPQCKVDEDDLVEKMKYYVKNLKRIEELKINTRISAENRLNWSQNANELSSIFKRVRKRNTDECKSEKNLVLNYYSFSYKKFISFFAKYPRFFNMLFLISKKLF